MPNIYFPAAVVDDNPPMHELSENNLPGDPNELYVKLADYEAREKELQERVVRWAEIAMELRVKMESAIDQLDLALQEAEQV
jgi:hypothetical protein